MTYGITGNTSKENFWQPAAQLVSWLLKQDVAFCLHADVAQGLADRQFVDRALCAERTGRDLAGNVDVILSFGGDGTLLNSAHEVGDRGTPILGINIGRLGFLADIEVAYVQQAIEHLEQGDYRIEPRMVLEARLEDGIELVKPWALNEFVIERSGLAKLMSITVTVDGSYLNEYWADGLIIATPTGSTAYSLSVGGPIMVPDCGAVILTPIAPHTLTVRPIVLPDHAVIEARVLNNRQPYVIAADGVSMSVSKDDIKITIRRAAHVVNLVKLPDQHYFKTIRSKLMWGLRSYEQTNSTRK
jgi:NAD+ kinase